MHKISIYKFGVLLICLCTAVLACNNSSALEKNENVAAQNQGNEVVEYSDTTKELYPFIYPIDENGNRIEYADDAKKGYKDLQNNIIIKPIYQQAGIFKEGLAPVKKDNLWGFIKKDGKTHIQFQYDTVFSFDGGTAYVRKEMKWGKINKAGEVVVPFIYTYPYEFNEGLALFESNGKYGFIDATLKEILSPI